MKKYFKKLVGNQIYLSPRSIEDVENYVEWLNDFETTDYIGRSHLIMTVEIEKEYLEKNTAEEASFSIVKLEDNRMIGTCSIENINHIHRIGTLGIFIGDIEEREKGYGTEALNLILDYGFHYLNLNNIMLEVMSFNERAIHAYQKVGFKEIGKRRNARFINGKYYDIISMDILAEEFEKSCIQNKNVK